MKKTALFVFIAVLSVVCVSIYTMTFSLLSSESPNPIPSVEELPEQTVQEELEEAEKYKKMMQEKSSQEESEAKFSRAYKDKAKAEEYAKKKLEEEIKKSKKVEEQPVTVADKLTDAAIAYNAPKDAIVGSPFSIMLRIDPSATVEQLKQEMPSLSGNIVAKQIHVSQIVKVDLTVDEEQFRLVKLSPVEQALFVTEPNIWQWELTALKAGTGHISISITALVHIGDHETNHFITAYSDDIVITATTEQKIKALYEKHKDKLWGLLVVPAFEWARRRFNKWREDKKSEKNDE